MINSLPEEFVSRVKTLFGDQSSKILSTFESRKPSTFRTNLLKTTSTDLIAALTNKGFEIEESVLPNSFILSNKTQRELTEIDEYKNGLFYIQGLSSMIPPLILEPQELEIVLDACSAPGSKTTQIAGLMNNTGQIIANDMSKIRLYKLAANLKTLGVTNTTTTHFRAQDLWRKFPNTFDRILVDVPCSLEGRFFTAQPKSFAQWSVKKVKTLSEHQKHILRSAVSCAKSGATIIYSTCTLSPEENEGVVDWILSKDPTISLQKVDIPKVETMAGLSEWQGTHYKNDMTSCVRITPSSLFEGFFLAKFLKQ